MGTSFEFDIELRYGAGAFVCGEETALIHSMEDYVVSLPLNHHSLRKSGYLGKPTNVNNVDGKHSSYSLKGSAWFASIGTEKSKGTKVFALAGKINNVKLLKFQWENYPS